MKKNNFIKRYLSVCLFLTCFLFIFTGCAENINQVSGINTSVNTENNYSKVIYIDSGNSDSILIENNSEFALIDGGDLDDDELMLRKLAENNVKKIKYLFVSHAHADHLGGLDSVVKNYDIENIYFGNGEATTRAYKDLLKEINNKGYEIKRAKENEELKLGNGTFKLLNTNWNKDNNLNNHSLIIKYLNGNDTFLFTGDAEKEVSENVKGKLGQIDVVKASHHGSHNGITSSEDILKEINPKDIIITAGKGNRYGHPHKETLNKLSGKNIYRNDINGEITVTSNGNGYEIKTEK